jgi:mRNA-degrading endonuclease RelE of RelBE toxin-antitoxin system
MVLPAPYRIELSPDVLQHLRALTARHQATILAQIPVQLIHQPASETRNRKPLREHPIASWELRIGSLRVFYDVQDEPDSVVFVRAVGIKERNRLRIGREVIEP